MKITQLISVAALSIVLAACASKVRLDDLPPVDNTKSGDTTLNTGTGGASGKGTGDGGVKTVDVVTKGIEQPNAGLLAKRSVYFDLDSYTINPEFKAVLEAHAKNLTANRTAKVALEGNTDESGGREYNLALGQKRANAVVQALRVLGVADAQMEAVSFGKEKPKAQGAGEAAAAENRRADIAYK
jgi:peptidoglycan-associated lipoprotein